MEEDDKGCPMIRMGVSGWVFLLVPAYPGCPRPKAIKRLCVCVVVVQFQLNDKRLVLAKNQFIQAQNIKLLIKKWWLKNVEIDIIIILEQLSSLFLPAS